MIMAGQLHIPGISTLSDYMELFNNRELALASWLAVIIVAVLMKRSTRVNVGGIIRSALEIKLVIPFLLMLAYVTATVLILHQLELWQPHQLKDTIYWFLFSCIILTFRSIDHKLPQWKSVFRDNFKMIVVLTFIINTYTFSLPVEFLILPILLAIGLIGAFAELDEKHKPVARLMNTINASMGWLILLAAGVKAVQEYETAHLYTGIEGFLLPIILTLTFIPFIYFFIVYVVYDSLWCSISSVSKSNVRLARYMKWTFIQQCMLSLNKLKYARAIKPYEIIRVKTKIEFDALLVEHGVTDK